MALDWANEFIYLSFLHTAFRSLKMLLSYDSHMSLAAFVGFFVMYLNNSTVLEKRVG